jgi:hypothetical protein
MEVGEGQTQRSQSASLEEIPPADAVAGGDGAFARKLEHDERSNDERNKNITIGQLVEWRIGG